MMFSLEWVFFSILASAFQVARGAFQKSLKKHHHSLTVAWCRYIFGLPFLILAGIFLFYGSFFADLEIGSSFWFWVLLSGLSQCLATILHVELLGRRSLTLGIVVVKLEAVFALVLGVILVGEQVTFSGVFSVFLGVLGLVAVIMPEKKSTKTSEQGAMFEVLGFGVSSAFLFSVAAVTAKAAMQNLSGVEFMGAAAITLFFSVAMQAFLLGLVVIRGRVEELRAVFGAPRIPALIGITGILGSFCWFSAFSLANVAYVKTVAQIEVVFSVIIGRYYFSDRLNRNEIFGSVAIVISAVMLAFSRA